MDPHPLQDLIGLKSLLGDNCAHDLERVIALHAQAVATVCCEDSKLRALLEGVLTGWLNRPGFAGGHFA